MKARFESLYGGKVARIVLAAPKANIVDRGMVEELDAIFDKLTSRTDLCAIVLAADGPHFSFGASIEEHLPDQIEGALARLGGLLRRILNAPAPVIAAVHGQCLGGGFEVVLACDLIIAEEGSQLGAPEIRLGVFPPAASALLPVRVGSAAASLLTLSGNSWDAATAFQHGLVARVAPAGALESELTSWLESDFVPRSPTGLRFGAQVIRRPVLRALDDELPQIDRVYLQQLMQQPDGAEGIRAFLEKRPPRWSAQAVPK